MPTDSIVGTQAAAQILKVKQSTVSQYCRDGKFPNAVQDGTGHPWHIPVAEIEAFINRRGRKSETK